MRYHLFIPGPLDVSYAYYLYSCSYSTFFHPILIPNQSSIIKNIMYNSDEELAGDYSIVFEINQTTEVEVQAQAGERKSNIISNIVLPPGSNLRVKYVKGTGKPSNLRLLFDIEGLC